MPTTRFRDLGNLTVEERETYMRNLLEQECVPYRTPKETVWLEAFRYFRALSDKTGPFRSQMRHPYAFAAVMAIQSAIFPAFFSSEPPFQILDPNPENRDRNTVLEELITAQLRHTQRSNFRTAFDDILLAANVFGSAYPWVYWRSQTQPCGPFYEPVLDPVSQRPFLDIDGTTIMQKRYKMLRTYHGPWVEHFELWDTFMHPDGVRGFSIRDMMGEDLLSLSQGEYPLFDRNRVDRMLRTEMSALQGSKSNEMFSGGNQAGPVDRDAFAREAGLNTMRVNTLAVAEDVLRRQYPIYYYDDPYGTGAYAVSQSGRFYELRWNTGASPDGNGCRLALRTHKSPGEVYGIGLLEEGLPLFKALSRFFQAAHDGAALTVNPIWLSSMKFKEQNPNPTLSPGAILEAPTLGGEPLDTHLKRLDMPQTWANSVQFVEYIVKSLDVLFGQGSFTRGQYAGSRTSAYEVNRVTQFTEVRLKQLHERVTHQFGVPLLRKMMCLNSMHLTSEDLRLRMGPVAETIVMPTIEELVESLLVVPKGSLESGDALVRASRWPAILKTLIEGLPYLRFRPVNEAFRRMLEDNGIDAVSRVMPAATDEMPTEFSVQASRGGGGVPRSPADMTTLMRMAGGATAPPGPAEPMGNEMGMESGNGYAA